MTSATSADQPLDFSVRKAPSVQSPPPPVVFTPSPPPQPSDSLVLDLSKRAGEHSVSAVASQAPVFMAPAQAHQKQPLPSQKFREFGQVRAAMPAHMSKQVQRAPMAHSKQPQSFVTSLANEGVSAMAMIPSTQIKREPLDRYDYSKVIEVSDDSDADDVTTDVKRRVTSDSEVDDAEEAREVYSVFNLKPPADVTPAKQGVTSLQSSQVFSPINIVPATPTFSQPGLQALPLALTSLPRGAPLQLSARAAPLFIVQPQPLLPAVRSSVLPAPMVRSQKWQTVAPLDATASWGCPYCRSGRMSRDAVLQHLKISHPGLPASPVPYMS